MKKDFIDTFLTAGIAYYLNGDWRNTFRLASYRSIGSFHKVCSKWIKKSDEDFQRALDNFFEVDV